MDCEGIDPLIMLDFPQDPGSLFWEASFGKHTWKPLKHGFLDLAKN